MFVTKRDARDLIHSLETAHKVMRAQDRLIDRLTAEIDLLEEEVRTPAPAFSGVSPGQGADHTLSRPSEGEWACSCGWRIEEVDWNRPSYAVGAHLVTVTPVAQS